jgi:uncharacterized membrane protein YedE/YeeE
MTAARRNPAHLPALLAALGALGLLWFAARAEGAGHAAALLIGGFAGLALYHASFGFTAAWRRLVRERDGQGVRAQLILLVLASAVSYPLIDAGLAQPVILPLGLASAIGAFLFGAGMQLGGGCGSGTLYTAGGGSTRMMLTLAAFIAGSAIATFHMPAWQALPVTRTGFSALRSFGLAGALALLVSGAGLLWWLSRRIERPGRAPETPAQVDWLRGPWPIRAGAVALALVAILHFTVLGRPWGITWGFAVWGGQAAQALGFDPASEPFWQEPWRAAELAGGPLSSVTNASNLGILCGALAASALAGRFAPVWRLSRRDVLTALAGGLLMGYGARLAGGCNIGAFLGGVTSASLHGLWWLVFAFAGSWGGVALRARLAMDPPLNGKVPA